MWSRAASARHPERGRSIVLITRTAAGRGPHGGCDQPWPSAEGQRSPPPVVESDLDLVEVVLAVASLGVLPAAKHDPPRSFARHGRVERSTGPYSPGALASDNVLLRIFPDIRRQHREGFRFKSRRFPIRNYDRIEACTAYAVGRRPRLLLPHSPRRGLWRSLGGRTNVLPQLLLVSQARSSGDEPRRQGGQSTPILALLNRA